MTVKAILYVGERNDPCIGFQGGQGHRFDAEQKSRLALEGALPTALFLGMAFRLHALTPTIVMSFGYSAVE